MLISIDSGSDRPIYRQIRDEIRERIVNGALKAGERLEPSRELAKRLGVHRTTVGNAYAELEAEGLIQGTVGRGTFVTQRAAAPGDTPPRPAPADFFWDGFFGPEPPDDLGQLMASASVPGVISFAVGRASLELSPVTEVRRAIDAVLRREGAALLQYGTSDGYPPLKRYLAARLRRNGIPAAPAEVVITSGCQQSLDLVRRALIGRGDAVASENPSYPGLWRLFQPPDVRLVALPVRRDGMDLNALESLLEREQVKLILTSPTFQNPTGRTMPIAARRRLLALAARYQTPVLEDDIYSELRYRGPSVPPLKSLDDCNRVIYVGSFSKIGFPSLRVGWIVAPERVIERLCAIKQRSDLHTSLLSQAVLEELGRRGWLEKLVRKTRTVYARKLAILEQSVQRHFPPEAHCDWPEGGMSVWVELPEGLDSAELLVKAQDRGIVFAPARHFYFQAPQRNALRLSFASLTDDEIAKGITVLGELLKTEVHRAAGRGKPERAGMALV